MCSLCGMLGGAGHWSNSAQSPEVFRERARTHTLFRERQERTRLLNHVLAYFGLSVSDWEAKAIVLRNRTGQTALPESLPELWAEAERLAKRPCDPLDDSLLNALQVVPRD